MSNRNHFLGPHFSFTKAVVRTLMGSGINNSFVGLFKEKEQKLSLLLCSQCHHSYANDNVDKAICIIILTRKWEETKIMQDICWNGCIVTLKKYHEFLFKWLVCANSIGSFEFFDSKVWRIHFNCASHETDFIFFCCPMKLHQSMTYQEEKDWLEWFSRWEIWNIFLLIPMLKLAVSNNCS